MDILNLLLAIIAIIISIFSFYESKKQANISKNQFTLSYLEMENNDSELLEARRWLLNLENKTEYITSFSSQENFLRYKGYEIKKSESGLYDFPNKDLVNEYILGLNYINKIIASRQIASEAIILKNLDEDTYRLVRLGDFSRDYLKLKDFIIKQHEIHGSSYDRKAFRILVHKWKNEIIDNFDGEISKDKWDKHNQW